MESVEKKEYENIEKKGEICTWRNERRRVCATELRGQCERISSVSGGVVHVFLSIFLSVSLPPSFFSLFPSVSLSVYARFVPRVKLYRSSSRVSSSSSRQVLYIFSPAAASMRRFRTAARA